MSDPTEFQIKCAQEACGGEPWPDLSHITFKAPAEPVVVVTRACVRCRRPVTGEQCPTCRAYQDTYVSAP